MRPGSTLPRLEPSGPALTLVPLGDGDLPRALEAMPRSPGVGQILGPEGRNLVVGRPANLRTWAAGHLGRARPRRAGLRPPTDLSPIATAVAYVETTSTFGQRLAFERVMSRHVPPARRRDLKPAAWIHLDPGERFPRAGVRVGPPAASSFGPFPGREAAQRAVTALHKRLALRPCDYTFEPDPALPLGLGCVYAQVRTCVAPCLSRVTEDEYRALAARAAALLADPALRGEEDTAWIPSWVAASGARGVVVEEGRSGLELYPVLGGAVLGDRAAPAAPGELEAAMGRLLWDGEPAGDDTPWLLQWLRARRRTGRYVVVGEGDTLGREVR